MGFVLSTEFVIWAAVGGKASPLGALLGAVFIGYASSELRDHFAYWEVAVGAIFIVVVRFLPEGLAGLGRPLWRRGPAAAPGVPATDAPARHAPDARIGLAFEQVHAAQGGVRILDGLSLALDGPGLRCVIGPNGAGKTSAFNVMTGRLPLRSGRILLDGADISGATAWQVARRGVGRKLQIPSVFSELSVSQEPGRGAVGRTARPGGVAGAGAAGLAQSAAGRTARPVPGAARAARHPCGQPPRRATARRWSS